ncbi:GNAT family N-acetyltransferase [Pseudozobellia sp. WGM2]|uniref:GNAT family N-acetyltransferase n=1 Tax=Pseudozobellia sp. WGM2 TaxID=2787625 RepID=UPI001ADF829C|nr:GNAT family N-acetyltransferase [Pseudozobellia sp. WGM2]
MTSLLLEDQETERLLFRKVLKSDFEDWLPFHEDKRTSQYWEGLPENPYLACQQQFDRIFERYEKGLGGMNALISKANNKLVGLSGLLVQKVDHQEELEIAYSLLPTYWGKGFAKEAAQRCKAYVSEQQLSETMISIIQIHNTPSQKVASSLGMHIDNTTTYSNNKVYIYRIHL